MRKVLMYALLGVAALSFIAMIAALLGASLGENARPMLFARLFVVAGGLAAILWRWGGRQHSYKN